MAKDPISSIMKHVNHSPFFYTIVCMSWMVLGDVYSMVTQQTSRMVSLFESVGILQACRVFAWLFSKASQSAWCAP